MTKYKRRKIGRVSDLAVIDANYRCVMVPPSSRTTWHSMTTKKKKKTTRTTLQSIFAAKVEKKKKNQKRFFGMAASDRRIFTWRNADKKYNFHVLAQNNRITTTSGPQGYNNEPDMVNELHRLWPHLAIKDPDQTSINDR